MSRDTQNNPKQNNPNKKDKSMQDKKDCPPSANERND